MHRGYWLGPALFFGAGAAMAAAVTPVQASEREVQTVQCVAALDASTRELAAQVKNGQPELRELLLGRLKSGVAFTGTAYLSGERDEQRTKALLDSALETQKALPEREMAARQAACEVEGTRLLAGASALEKALVSRVAAKRMQRLLAE